MTILGSQIDEINAIRKNLGSKTINIKSNVEIQDLSRKNAVIFEKKEDILEFTFKFNIEYNAKSNITLIGTVFYDDKKEVLDEIEKQWSKNKKIDTKLVLPILNHAMELGYKNAFTIADKLRLPSPVRLPKFISEPKNKK